MTRALVAVLGGHVAWTVQLVASYLVVAYACPGGAYSAAVAPLAGPLLALASVVPLVAATLAAVVAYRLWRRGPTRALRFLGLFGLLLDLLFIVTIAFGVPPLAALSPCAAP